MAGKLKGKFAPSEIKKHVLTAISYLLPLIVASGLLIAIGNIPRAALTSLRSTNSTR